MVSHQDIYFTTIDDVVSERFDREFPSSQLHAARNRADELAKAPQILARVKHQVPGSADPHTVYTAGGWSTVTIAAIEYRVRREEHGGISIWDSKGETDYGGFDVVGGIAALRGWHTRSGTPEPEVLRQVADKFARMMRTQAG